MTGKTRLAVRALGVVQLFIAALGARGALYSFARLAQEDAFNPLWAIRQAPAQYKQLLLVGTLLEVGALVLALTSGLALLGLRKWAWGVTATFCVVRICAVSVQGGNYYVNILRPHLHGLEEATHSPAPGILHLQPLIPFVAASAYPVVLLVGILLARRSMTLAE